MRASRPMDRGEEPRRPEKIVGLHSVFTAFLVGIGLLFPLFNLSAEAALYPTSVLLVLLFIWSVASWRRVAGSTFDPYMLFLVAAMLFNAGQAVLEVFGLNDEGILGNRFSAPTTLAALYLVLIGLAFLHLGALLARLRRQPAPPAADEAARRSPITPVDIRRVGYGLLLLSLLPAALLMRDALAVVLAGGYAALYQTDAATGVEAGPRVLASFLIPGALFLLAGSKDDKVGRLISGLALVSYAASQLFLGYRYQAVMPLIAYVWLWHRCIWPVRRSLLVGSGAVLLLVVFPLVGVIRDTGGADRGSLGFFLAAFSSINNPAVAAIAEMGNTLRTVADTYNLVPSYRNFDSGASYFYALLTAFPNVFWDIHPSIAHGTASLWLTRTVEPIIAANGGGLGYSFIAEAYLNFGWLGVPVILALTGLGYSRLVGWAEQWREPAKLALLASLCAFFTFYTRGESALIVRPLLWYSLFPYLLVLVVAYLRHPRLQRLSAANLASPPDQRVSKSSRGRI